nr:peroxisomal membrane protein pex16 [Quercus suber]
MILMAGFILFLLPFSLVTYQRLPGYDSAGFIAMVIIGVLLFPVFALWEKFGARVQFVQWELFKKPTVLGACALACLLNFSFYCWDSQYYYFVLVVYNLSVSYAGYMGQIYNVGSTFSGVLFGIWVRYSKHFKYEALCFGLPLILLGSGLVIHFRGQEGAIGYVIMTQIFIAFGGGILVISQSMAVMAAADRAGVPMAISLVSLFASVGSAIGSAVASAIYGEVFPKSLAQMLPAADQNLVATIFQGGYAVQLDYLPGSVERDAINYAYGQVQKWGGVASTAVLIGAIPAIAVWKNYNVDKKQNKVHGCTKCAVNQSSFIRRLGSAALRACGYSDRNHTHRQPTNENIARLPPYQDSIRSCRVSCVQCFTFRGFYTRLRAPPHRPRAMERLRQVAEQTKLAVSLPPQWINMYSDFITKNAGAVGQVEGALRSLTYILPGRFRESEIASESLNSSVQLVALYHDILLSRAMALSLHGQKIHQTPHARYTRFYCQKSATYRRTALSLSVVQYTELLLEMLAKRQGEQTRWRVIVLLEAVKATCRLILMRLTNSRPLLSPPLPERELVVEDQQAEEEKPAYDENLLPSPPSERSEAGSEKWTMPRTSLTLPPLPSSEDISSYLLSKVLTADDIKPPKALLHRVSGLGEAAEILYIIRPVLYAMAMAYWCQREDGRGKADWRPWLLGLSIEYGARQLAKHDLEARRPGGARGLTQLEREELKKRGWALGWWTMRGAFYENVTRGMIGSVAGKLKNKPLLDMVGSIIEDYEYLWDQHYFPTATL